MWEEVDDFSYAWCHGAPGILLGALEVTRHVPGIFPEQTLSRLAELTVTRGFGTNPTYCHGDLGSLETVLLAEQVSPGLFGDGVDDLYPRLFTEVVERYSERSDTKYTYSNGIMLGQAGLIWSILRHLDPKPIRRSYASNETTVLRTCGSPEGRTGRPETRSARSSASEESRRVK